MSNFFLFFLPLYFKQKCRPLLQYLQDLDLPAAVLNDFETHDNDQPDMLPHFPSPCKWHPRFYPNSWLVIFFNFTRDIEL